jgi:formylglycine-generating enzyme required for sulfatase activity
MLHAMKRLLALLAIVACGKSGGHDAPKPKSGSDSTTTKPSDAATGSGSAIAIGSAAPFPDQEPTTPPPPPTVVPQTKGDCKAEYAPKPTRDPNPMCKIDGGTFLMGEKEKVPTKLSPYYIDEFEVTVAQFVFFLNTTHGDPACVHYMPDGKPAVHGLAHCYFATDAEGNRSNHDFIRQLDNGTFVAERRTEHLPFQKAMKEAARDYCAWAGKQLPTQAQWEFAARHDPKTGRDFIFPWGDKFDGRRARCTIEVCPDAPGLDPVNGEFEGVAVGTYDGTHGHADGRSPWGLYQMAGNVNELIADCQHDLKPCVGGACVDPSVTEPQLLTDPLNPPAVECQVVSLGGDAGAGETQLHSGVVENPQAEGGFRCARVER